MFEICLPLQTFLTQKGVRAMWVFLKSSKNKGDVPGRKEWEMSEVGVRLWEK